MRPASKKRPWLNIKGTAAILTPVVFCQMRRPELQEITEMSPAYFYQLLPFYGVVILRYY